MKKNSISAITLLITTSFLPLISQAETFSDQFTGSSLDSSLWTASTPFTDSSVAVSGGSAILTNRGRILSLNTLPTDFDLLGRFRFSGSSFDHLRIVMFTDGVQSLSSGEFNGLTLQFGIKGDLGNTDNNIDVDEANFPSSVFFAGTATVSLSLNTFYDFKLSKSGNNFSVFVTDMSTPIITGTSSFSSGTRLALYNREGSGGGSSISAGSQVEIDYVQIVPEPSTYAYYGVVSLLGLLYYKTRKPRRA